MRLLWRINVSNTVDNLVEIAKILIEIAEKWLKFELFPENAMFLT